LLWTPDIQTENLQNTSLFRVKHLFLVHSPITYLASIAVIKDLKINKDDAILIFNEFGEISSTTHVSFSINKFYKNKGIKKIYNYVRYFNIVNRIDKLVNAAVENENFIAYIPVLHLIGKSLITHPLCNSFNFIEEGLGNYYKEETLQGLAVINSKDSWRSSFSKNTKRALNEMYMVIRGYNFKLQSIPFSYSCYTSFREVNFYGLSNESFPLADKKKRIILPFQNEWHGDIKQAYKLDLDHKIIWIGDASVKQLGFSEDVYLQGIENGCVRFIKDRNKNEIFIKFHRDENESLRQKIKKIFLSNNISLHIIPDSVIMELQLFKAENVTLIGVYSSLLFYGSIMGHHSFSIYEFLKKEYSKALKNRDFDFFWHRVELIKPAITV